MRTLTRYIGRDVLWSTLLLFVALIGLFTFFDLINEMRDVGPRQLHAQHRAPVRRAARAVAALRAVSGGGADRDAVRDLAARVELRVHGDARVRRIDPAGRLGRRARGHSARHRHVPRRRIRRAAGGAPRADACSAAALGNATGVVAQQFESGFWFKQDLTFVNIRTVLSDMTLVGVRIYEFDRDLRLTAVRSAESGKFDRRRPLEAREGEGHRDRPRLGQDVSSQAELAVDVGAAAVDPDRLPGRAGAPRAVDALRQHPRARHQRAEDLALRDRASGRRCCIPSRCW